MKLRRCDICGSPFHKTQPTPSWALEYVLTLMTVVIGVVVIGAVAMWIAGVVT